MSAPIPETADAVSFSPRRVIERAARETGADFDFLLRTAARESSFDAGAQRALLRRRGCFNLSSKPGSP
jgi:hypothetical protein